MVSLKRNVGDEQKNNDDGDSHQYGIEQNPAETALYALGGIENAECESEHKIFVTDDSLHFLDGMNRVSEMNVLVFLRLDFLSHLIFSFAYYLMSLSSDEQHDDSAQKRCQGDRHNLSFYQIEIEHEGYAWRHEKEAEIGNKKISQSAHPFQLDDFELQQKREDEHTDNACRKFDVEHSYDEFSKGETPE